MDEVRKAMLEMGRGLRKHLEKKKKMVKVQEKFELVNDIIPAIAAKSAAILDRPVPDLAGSITRIMGAVIAESTTVWNKETKETDVSITLFNYTSRARAYTLLASWPEREGAGMERNETGGRKEATGVWAWKLETLEPGQTYTITYALSGLEKGDWTETDVFYRGSQEVIGASKMDEKLLEEIRRQEARAEEDPAEEMPEQVVSEADDAGGMPPPAEEREEPKSSGQQTLMGYGSDA
jgi:DNA topoisomerase-6 subunit B